MEATDTLSTLVSLAPQGGSGEDGMSEDTQVLAIAREMEQQSPQVFNVDEVAASLRSRWLKN